MTQGRNSVYWSRRLPAHRGLGVIFALPLVNFCATRIDLLWLNRPFSITINAQYVHLKSNITGTYAQSAA